MNNIDHGTNAELGGTDAELFNVFIIMTINLVLTILLFVIFFSRFSLALWLALGGGLVLELFNAAPFGVLTTALLISLALSNLLFNYFFTNRSLPALLALGLCGTLIYQVIFFFLNFLVSLKVPLLFSLTIADDAPFILWSLIFNNLALLLIFLVFKRFSKRLKAVFLVK